MTKEEAWERHMRRVHRLIAAHNKRAEAGKIKEEMLNEGVSYEIADRAIKESWRYAKAIQEGKIK